MASTDGRQALTIKEPSLEDSLKSEPFEFELHQAIRLLESLREDSIPLGEGVEPWKEAVALKSRVFMDWPPSDISEVDQVDDTTRRPQVHVNAFGLAGGTGPLPVPFVELILQRLMKKDKGFRDFLDIFNHRLTSLLHRIRKKYWVGLNPKLPLETRLTDNLLSFAGLGEEALQKQQSLQDAALISGAGLFWRAARSACGLEGVLRAYLGVHVCVKSLQGTWRELDKEHCTSIGYQGTFNVLGRGAMLGRKAWDQQGRAEIVLGPLNKETFDRLLKSGDMYLKVIELIRMYLEPSQDFRVRLIAAPDAVTPTYLDGTEQLGWSSWMIPDVVERSDDQVILYPKRFF